MKLVEFSILSLAQAGNILNNADTFWNNYTPEELAAECAKFPENQRPSPCDERGTAFDGQMMMFSSAGQYGCWCDINNGLKRSSNAEPVNSLDYACRDLHHNYNCIQIDDSSCNPRALDATKGEYNLPLSALSPLVSPEDACASFNIVDSCAYNTCLVESYFLRETITPVYGGDPTWIEMWDDVNYQHSPIGNFDFNDQCDVAAFGIAGVGCGPNGCGPATIAGARTNGKQCCGQYPAKTAYYPERAQCCEDVIEPLGTC